MKQLIIEKIDTDLLRELLVNHDWNYSRSDDHNKWVNGLQSEEAIRDEMDRLGNTEEVKDMYANRGKEGNNE
jgi:hypothetical protein|tara:strand:- start:488 stop:703 length:216 start_codon:yes stop_codon:yes gene_type:complete